MKKIFVVILYCCINIHLSAQQLNTALYKTSFSEAYATYPSIPRGLLEGVAYAQTRIQHISGNNQGCSGIPQVSGVMGLTEDGKGYFNNNLIRISRLSGYSVHNIKSNPDSNIKAYAKAYSILAARMSASPTDFAKHDQLLKSLSEIPWDKNAASTYALSCFTYEVFQFMKNPYFQSLFEFPAADINLAAIYGEENLAVLTSQRIGISETAVVDESAHEFRGHDRSAEFGPAIWNAAPACNYSSRAGVAISAVTVHTIQGSYAGAISWAQNCASNVSYHYVARSSDGQITQMVLEANKAWHVGSENPYTIGIEHEGYVDNPIWYTEAMYVSSANLVRDITASGYGINPLRTFQGPATAGTLTLGACTKIKGHQHFPGAAHTDPGINWNWEHYYQLINNTPTVTTLVAGTGTLYDSGGAGGNYGNDERNLYLIQPPGATSVTLNIDVFSIEDGWDFMRIYDGEDLDVPLIGTYTGTDIPDIISSSGGSILLEFRSDCGDTGIGWDIDWSTIIGSGDGDELAPITAIVLDADWFTEDFTVTFADADDSLGSGINYQFFQVIDFDGTEWRANDDHGFFSDNFDVAIHPDWSSVTGTWGIFDETLRQSNEALGNTNSWANLNQDDFDSYLYHWSGKISGAGADKRAGFHFMCDNPLLINRGNSYFVWFREDNDKVQIYKVIDDVFTLEEDVVYPFSPDTWYDFKTVYDKSTGEINVWVNNVHVASWTDPAPYTTGNSISFRSGNAIYDVNNLKVYHNRALESVIAVGPTGDARYLNPDPFTPAAKVKSIVIDSALNVSTIADQLLDIDWTPPLEIAFLNDGLDADIATTTSNTELKANWAVTSDPNSGIARYWYAIGTSPGAIDIVDWTDNWFADSVVHTGLTLTLGETYYFSVAAENGAGLWSTIIHSNGQMLIEPTEPPIAVFMTDHTNLCGLDSIKLENGSTDALSYEWFIPTGTPTYSTSVNPYVHFASAGIHPVTLVAAGPGGVDTLVQDITVEVDLAPISAFTPSSVLLFLADPLVTFDNSSLNADGYYWEFGDGEVSTDESPWHAYAATGDFYVSLIAINGDCPNDTSTTLIEVRDVDGINELSGLDFDVYPNPATDFIQLISAFPLDSPFNYLIYDAQGKLVQQGNQSKMTGNQQIYIGDLAKGLYYLKIDQTTAIYLSKFLVQ